MSGASTSTKIMISAATGANNSVGLLFSTDPAPTYYGDNIQYMAAVGGGTDLIFPLFQIECKINASSTVVPVDEAIDFSNNTTTYISFSSVNTTDANKPTNVTVNGTSEATVYVDWSGGTYQHYYDDGTMSWIIQNANTNKNEDNIYVFKWF